MPDRADIIYVYDGSFEGLLCCVFESFEKKELPTDILPADAPQFMMYRTHEVVTDLAKAARVRVGIVRKASAEAFAFVRHCYYSCHPAKERLILDYVHLCMVHGKKVLYMLSDTVVAELRGAVMKLLNEAHKYKGFARFSVNGGVLVSVIEPHNFVLPELAPHFCDRYGEERFIIYDKTHDAALIYRPYEASIISIEGFEAPDCDDDEAFYRSMWRTFYDAVAIEERYNPKCRMSMMPKRYWEHMVEMTAELSKNKHMISEASTSLIDKSTPTSYTESIKI